MYFWYNKVEVRCGFDKSSLIKELTASWVLANHACKTSYLGAWDRVWGQSRQINNKTPSSKITRLTMLVNMYIMKWKIRTNTKNQYGKMITDKCGWYTIYIYKIYYILKSWNRNSWNITWFYFLKRAIKWSTCKIAWVPARMFCSVASSEALWRVSW